MGCLSHHPRLVVRWLSLHRHQGHVPVSAYILTYRDGTIKVLDTLFTLNPTSHPPRGTYDYAFRAERIVKITIENESIDIEVIKDRIRPTPYSIHIKF
jgi:hypothetical protein